MIYFLTTRRNQHPIQTYLGSWAAETSPAMKPVLYDELPRERTFPTGTYVFADLELATPAEASMGALLYEQLNRAPDRHRTLNDPGRYVSRFDLLSTLNERGVNQFRVAKASDPNVALRFPVFLREARRHTGNLSGLLHNRQELRTALREARLRGYLRSDLLVVEFCDTSDARRLFRKYSAFMLGDEIIPRHLIFSHHWVVKVPDLIDTEKLREEQEYLEQNPHREWIREIFDLAGIRYGRIDYGLLGGRPQLWEINTNPVILMRPEKYDVLHLPTQHQFARRIRSAFEALDTEATGDPMEVAMPVALQWRLKFDNLGLLLARARKKLARELIGPHLSV